MYSRDTSLITILSSEHGRLRRDQRDIRKRDLKKALRYGSAQRVWGQRWKIEYDGIVFITDDSKRREVTCYPAPLKSAPIDSDDRTGHAKAKLVIAMKPDLCASHTVLVVDNSGSMRTHDIILHRDRQTAAFSTMAMEYVAEQLFNATANNRDVVSLIEFSKTPKIVFKREPISWVLYNKLLTRRDSSNFVDRVHRKNFDGIICDSNYIPALEKAEALLELKNHEDCALSMFFISDGEPTDARHQGLVPSAARRLMNERVAKIATKFDYQLNMSFVGFGGAELEFETMKEMVEAANTASGMPRAKFVYCNKLANSIGVAVTSLVESTTLTRTALINGERRTAGNTRADIRPEQSNERNQYKILGHYGYDPMNDDWLPLFGIPMGALRPDNFEEASQMMKTQQFPPYISINKGYIGTGAERVAYRCHLSEENGDLKLGPMIAKETLRADRIDEHIAFHKSFCESQSLASHLAIEFNKRLQALPDFCPSSTPNVSFLKCSVLTLDDPEWRGGVRGILVEKQLDTDRFEWRKWNNNAGAVDGKIHHKPMDVDYEFANIQHNRLYGMAIIEEGSEESSDESEDDGEDEDGFRLDVDTNTDKFQPSDYLQAFSHFTYLFTNRKVLVCDLQGVYNTDLVPPTFELSDPAIHYRSNKGRNMVFGHTDKGQKGITLFFRTHKCSGICKIMQLTKKNTGWKKKWQRDYMEDMRNNFGS